MPFTEKNMDEGKTFHAYMEELSLVSGSYNSFHMNTHHAPQHPRKKRGLLFEYIYLSLKFESTYRYSLCC